VSTTPYRSRTRHSAAFLTVVASLAIALAAFPASVVAQGLPPALEHFLRESIELNADELSAVPTGRPVVKLLDTPDRLEIAVFGIVSIGVPRSFYVQRAVDFKSSLRSPLRPRFGIFSDPAVPADVASLSIPHDDVQDLRHCRPGSCQLKLSAQAIARLRASFDSAPSAADSAVTSYVRGRIIEYVTGYRARGNPALIVYVDADSAARAAEVFAAIVSRSPYMYQYAPSLERYLANYPSDRPADLSEVLFWSEEDLPSAKPTITITHEVVYAPPELPGVTLIAAKQLYADHYYDGALALTAVVDQGTGQAGSYVLFLRRLHFDELPSGGLINIRGKVIGKLRDATKAALSDAKTASEQAYAGTPASPR
jgi:hypothetical protein